MFLKFFVCLILPLCTAKPLRNIVEDMNIIKVCNASSPVDKDSFNRSIYFKRFEEDVSPKMKCFLLCLYKKYGWINADDGDFDQDNIKTELAEANLHKSMSNHLLKTCTNLDEYDPCERAYQFTSCIWREHRRITEDAGQLMDRIAQDSFYENDYS